MSTVAFRIEGGLDEPRLRQLHDTVLRVLDETGVDVPSAEIRERAGRHPGVRLDGTRARFDPSLVDGLVGRYRAEHGGATPADRPFTVSILTGYAFRILDRKDDAVRPITTADCTDMARLVDGLHGAGVTGGTPGMPQDAPVLLREVLAYKIGVENCRAASETGFSNYAAADAIRRMAAATGRGFGVPVFVIDPLRIDGDGVNIALAFIRAGIPAPLGFSSMPLRGLTAPMHLAGAFVSNAATVLGAYTLFACMDLPNPLRYHFDVYPMDLRTGSIAYGTPDHILMHLMGAQVNRFYGASAETAKPFHTNAVFPDAHAVAQRAAFASAAALAGAREFTFGGMLGVDKVFSAEQLLIDLEITRHVAGMASGIPFGTGALSFEDIAGAGPGGSFLTSEPTLRLCREQGYSDRFANLPMERLEAGGRGRLREEFLAEADRIIAAHDFELDAPARREVDDVWRAFQESARGGSPSF